MEVSKIVITEQLPVLWANSTGIHLLASSNVNNIVIIFPLIGFKKRIASVKAGESVSILWNDIKYPADPALHNLDSIRMTLSCDLPKGSFEGNFEIYMDKEVYAVTARLIIVE